MKALRRILLTFAISFGFLMPWVHAASGSTPAQQVMDSRVLVIFCDGRSFNLYDMLAIERSGDETTTVTFRTQGGQGGQYAIVIKQEYTVVCELVSDTVKRTKLSDPRLRLVYLDNLAFNTCDLLNLEKIEEAKANVIVKAAQLPIIFSSHEDYSAVVTKLKAVIPQPQQGI